MTAGRYRASMPFIALLLANVALAFGPLLVRLAESRAHVGPVGSAFWRLALAIPPLLLVSGLKPQPRLPRSSLGFVVLAGLLFAVDLALWHLGILHTRLANATLLGNITAILFPAYGFLVARHWPTRAQGAALMLAAVGAILLVGRSYQLSARNLHGDLLCIGAGLCYTGYLVAIQRARTGMGPIATLAGTVVAGAPILLVAALMFGDPIRPLDWLPLVMLTLGSQLIGQGLILYAVGRAPPLLVGIMLLIQPIVAAALGWVLYGERLGVSDLVGAAAICAAVVLVRDRPRRLRAPETDLSAAA